MGSSLQPFLLAVFLIAIHVHAVPWPGPKPTSVEQAEDNILLGWTPIPTQGVGINQLIRRDDGNYNLCGYENGWQNGSLQCDNPSASCVISLASGTIGAVGCCSNNDYTSCAYAASCVDYSQWYSNSICSTGCGNTLLTTWVCSATTAPYCSSWTYPEENAADYGCGAEIASTWVSVYRYYSGETDTGGNFLTFRNTITSSSSSSSSPPSSSSSSSSASSSSSIISSSTPSTPSPTVLSTSSTTTLPPPTTSSAHHSDAGAIAGGVVGGVVGVIALVALGYFCLFRKKPERPVNPAELPNQPALAAGSSAPEKPPQQMQQAPPQAWPTNTGQQVPPPQAMPYWNQGYENQQQPVPQQYQQGQWPTNPPPQAAAAPVLGGGNEHLQPHPGSSPPLTTPISPNSPSPGAFGSPQQASGEFGGGQGQMMGDTQHPAELYGSSHGPHEIGSA